MSVANASNGNDSLVIYLKKEKQISRPGAKYRVNAAEYTIAQLKLLIGEENIRIVNAKIQ